MKKNYLKSRPVCKVTFELPKAAVAGAGTVAVVGDFNDWRTEGLRSKRQKDGRLPPPSSCRWVGYTVSVT